MSRTLWRSGAPVAMLAVALASCSGLQPIVKRNASYDQTKGYVAGTFGSVKNSGFGLVLTDHIGRRFTLTFGEAKLLGGANREVTGVVELPPGDYRVTDWTTYERVTGRPEMTNAFPEGHPITRPFELKPGHLVYLGRFDAALERSVRYLVFVTKVHAEWAIAAEPITGDAVPPVIAREYPGFTAAPLECLLCLAAPPGTSGSAAPTLPPSPAYGKKEILLHYRRDGSYDGWGLWVWESFEVPADVGVRGGRKVEGDRPLAGITWEKPLPPTGIDDFGAYWALDIRNFGNGRVNYVLHRGQERDQDGHDMFWLVRDSREAWVNADDLHVYLSREEADAAWKSNR